MRKAACVALVVAGAMFFVVRASLASEADELRERAAAMKREMVELLEQGRKDEALDIRRGIEKMVQYADILDAKNKKQKEPAKKGKHPFGEAGERVDHIRQAADHLAAAGMKDMAEELRKHASLAEQELKRQYSQDAGKKITDSEGAQELRDDVRRLREQIEKLRSEVNELREQLKR